MKRTLCIGMICLLLVQLLCGIPVSAASDLSVSASAKTATVGQSITVTLKYDGGGKPIGGLSGRLTFDTKVFSYTSFTGNGVEVNGDAGVLKYVYFATGAEAPKSLTITFTFKAKAPGSGKFSIATDEFFDDTDYSSLGTPSGSVTVEASNPTLSGNADLKSIKPSRGTLKPKFDPDVTDYTIEVAYSVETLSLSATTDHKDAKTSIDGKNALKVGKNTRVITVTAPNGSTKKYTVVITRGEKPTTTTAKPTTTTTTEPIPEDALDVEVGGKTLTISDTQVPGDLPDGFSWGNVVINRVEVPAAINEQGATLLYLFSKEDESGNGFYLYDAAADTFTRYRSLKAIGGTWLLYDLPTDGDKPTGANPGTLVYEGGSVSAYVYAEAGLSDFYVVWAAPMDGTAGWYTYDASQGTFQRYHTTPTETTTTTATTTTTTTATPDEPKDQDTLSFDTFFTRYRKPMLIGGIALAGIVVLVMLVLVISSLSGRRNGKH